MLKPKVKYNCKLMMTFLMEAQAGCGLKNRLRENF